VIHTFRSVAVKTACAIVGATILALLPATAQAASTGGASATHPDGLLLTALPDSRRRASRRAVAWLPQLVAAAGQVGGLGGVARQLDGSVVGRA
jgi:hypothetical protein